MEITYEFNTNECPNKYFVFNKAVKCYVNLLNIQSLGYKEYKKRNNEIIFVIENSLIVYFTISKTTYLPTEYPFASGKEYADIIHPDKIYNYPPNYFVSIQEMTYNNLFKFNFTKFFDDNKFIYGDFQYFVFNGLTNTFGYIKNNIDHFMKSYPEFNLEKIYSVWEGIPYYGIIYEAILDNHVGYALCLTKSINVHSLARKKFGTIVYSTYSSFSNNKRRNTKYGTFSNDNSFEVDENFSKIMIRLINKVNYTKEPVYQLYDKYIKYLIVEIGVKEPNLLHSAKEHLFDRIYNNEFSNYERFPYIDGTSKWKSEQLVYDCLIKLYGEKNIIRQYRPLWLQTYRGNLTYDFYLPKLNIGIEYQGKQHFEPVSIFGGEDGFLKGQERDKLKATLSKQNNVPLIYINYWEKISVELIKNKIDNI